MLDRDADEVVAKRQFDEGDHDEHFIVQAFAQHRVASLRSQGVTVATLYGFEAGIEEGRRLARSKQR